MTAPRSSSAKPPPTGADGQPKVWAMLVFGGLATIAAFFLLATETDLTSTPRIAVSSILGCVYGWLASRYKLARIGALVFVVALVVIRIARDGLAA